MDKEKLKEFIVARIIQLEDGLGYHGCTDNLRLHEATIREINKAIDQLN